MLKKFAHFILKSFGWTLKVKLPEEKKFILIGAPHTSNWDFPLGLLTFWTLDLKIYWVAKIQMFRGPLHYLFTSLGGIPIDRSASHGFINQIAEKFNQSEEMVLTIAPEGTRSKTGYWKSGFYHIALAARVPICFGYIDYQNRTLGFEQVMYPSGDIEADMRIISDFYKNIKGRYPEKQGPIRIKNDKLIAESLRRRENP
jgi:1-acyl-sn-glycerol-3-phosphate acyltransferase